MISLHTILDVPTQLRTGFRDSRVVLLASLSEFIQEVLQGVESGVPSGET